MITVALQVFFLIALSFTPVAVMCFLPNFSPRQIWQSFMCSHLCMYSHSYIRHFLKFLLVVCQFEIEQLILLEFSKYLKNFFVLACMYSHNIQWFFFPFALVVCCYTLGAAAMGFLFAIKFTTHFYKPLHNQTKSINFVHEVLNLWTLLLHYIFQK